MSFELFIVFYKYTATSLLDFIKIREILKLYRISTIKGRDIHLQIDYFPKYTIGSDKKYQSKQQFE